MKRLHCNEQILIYVGIDIPGIVPFFSVVSNQILDQLKDTPAI